MPSSRRVRLTSEAQDDFRDILQYTRETWGVKQRDTYEARLKRGLRNLATFPEMGRARTDLGPGLRSFPIEHHLVIYRVDDDAVRVVRIVHGRRSPEDLLDE